MSRSARAFRATLATSFFGYASQGLSLVAIPLFLKTVGAENYGLMVTVMAFMGYVGFADAGLSWGSMILIAQAAGNDRRAEIASIVRHAAVLAAGSGLLVALVAVGVVLVGRAGWRLPMFAAHPDADRLILIAGLQLILTLQSSVVYNVFLGLQEGFWAGIYQGAARFFGLGAALCAAYLTHRIEAVMWVQLGFVALFGCIAAVHAWRVYPWAFAPGSFTDRAQFRVQLRIGAKSFLLQIGRTLGGTAPTLGISSVFGPASVPLYTVPVTLLTLFFAPINSWNANMQNAYGEAWSSGDREWVKRGFRLSLERAAVLGALGVALFFSLGDTFVRLWTHDRLWIEPMMAASIAASVVLTTFLTAGQFLLTGLNRHRNVALTEIANGALAIFLVVVVLRWFGLNAVGFGVVAAALATSVWVLRREVIRVLGAGAFPSFRFGVKILVVLGLSAGAAVLVVRLGTAGDVMSTLLKLIAGAGAGVVVFLAAAFVTELVAKADAMTLGRRFRARFFPISP
jgi:O-antigen/teichoic acid export membrane protein